MKLRAVLSSLFGKHSLALLFAFLLLIVAILMPRVWLPRATYNYVVVFDITQSMDVEDYEIAGEPISRLEYAKYAVRESLRDLPCGTRIGWGAFTEYRSLLLLAPVEVCEGYSDLLASLANINGHMRWANASEIGKGVYWAVRLAKEIESKPDVIFISDGHEAPLQLPGTPVTMPEDVQPGDVRGWIIGAGGDTPLPIPRTDDDDRRRGYWKAHEVIQLVSEDGTKVISAEHLSALRESHLQALADRVGFQYARLTAPASLSAAMREPRLVRRDPAPTDLYWIPVILSLLLLAAHFRPLPVRELAFRRTTAAPGS